MRHDLVSVARARIITHLMVNTGFSGTIIGKFRPSDGIVGITPVGQMGDVLAALRLATDTQLLQYPTVHRNGMAAGVRQYDHRIRFSDGPTNVGLLDDISLGELDAVVVLAGISVRRDDHRTPEGGVRYNRAGLHLPAGIERSPCC